MLTLTHTSTEGTLIDGTRRGDGTNTILKAHRWRWSSHLGSWYVPRSREHAADHARINATAAALREAGYEVTVEVTEDPIPLEDLHTNRRQRAAERADRLEVKAARHHAASDLAHDRAQGLADRIPLGQPILLGHHSEARARRDHDRISRSYEKSLAEHAQAREAERRAAAARANTASFGPSYVANKLKDTRAEIARHERELTGHERTLHWLPNGIRAVERTEAARGERAERIRNQLEQARLELAYWEDQHQELIARGEVADLAPDQVSVGDFIRQGHTWLRVRRVNKKSVTVDNPLHPGIGDGTVPYEKITEHRPADPTAS